MREIGKDIEKRGTKKAAAERLAKAAQKDFLSTWLIDEQDNFTNVMDEIREHAPIQYAKLYLEACKIMQTRETNINFNISRKQDYEELQARVRTRIPSSAPSGLPASSTVPDATAVGKEYTPYEEIPEE